VTTTDILGRIKTSQGLYFLYGNGFTDGAETELKVLDLGGNSVSVGELLAGQMIQEIAVQCSDGSVCTTLILYGPDAGIICSWRGRERLVGNDMHYNCEAKNLSVPVTRGMVLKINTAD